MCMKLKREAQGTQFWNGMRIKLHDQPEIPADDKFAHRTGTE